MLPTVSELKRSMITSHESLTSVNVLPTASNVWIIDSVIYSHRKFHASFSSGAKPPRPVSKTTNSNRPMGSM